MRRLPLAALRRCHQQPQLALGLVVLRVQQRAWEGLCPRLEGLWPRLLVLVRLAWGLHGWLQ
jgi:hypothetical protein